MKREVQVQFGRQVRTLRVEVLSGRLSSAQVEGRLEIALEGERLEADWAEVAPGIYSILLGGRAFEAQVSVPRGEHRAGRNRVTVTVGGRLCDVELFDPRQGRRAANDAVRAGPQEITAPMPGKIVRVLVAQGQEVSAGAGLLVVEAMKMQNELQAPHAGRVEAIYVTEGRGVEAGARLVRLA
jgi:biotin carboxyl carrier protein